MTTERALKRHVGRQPKLPPADAADRARDLASQGHSIVGIAAAFGVDFKTFTKWRDADPALQEAIDQGREKERQTLHNKLYVTAMGTGKEAMIAAMFLLKARHGYREGEQVDQSAKVAVQINLPGSMSMEQFTAMAGGPEVKVSSTTNMERIER